VSIRPVSLRVRTELRSLALICMLLPCAEHGQEVQAAGDQGVARKRGRAADGDGDGGTKAEDFDCHPLHSKSKEQMVSPTLTSSLPLCLSLSVALSPGGAVFVPSVSTVSNLLLEICEISKPGLGLE
jgi:hypothetical protein